MGRRIMQEEEPLAGYPASNATTEPSKYIYIIPKYCLNLLFLRIKTNTLSHSPENISRHN